MQHLKYLNGLCVYAYHKRSHTVTPGDELLINTHVVQYNISHNYAYDNMASVSRTDVE